MKRLASRSTWWHTLAHKNDVAVNAAERRGHDRWVPTLLRGDQMIE